MRCSRSAARSHSCLWPAWYLTLGVVAAIDPELGGLGRPPLTSKWNGPCPFAISAAADVSLCTDGPAGILEHMTVSEAL